MQSRCRRLAGLPRYLTRHMQHLYRVPGIIFYKSQNLLFSLCKIFIDNCRMNKKKHAFRKSFRAGRVRSGRVLYLISNFKKNYTFLKIWGVVVVVGGGGVVRDLTPSEPPPSIINQRITFYKVLNGLCIVCNLQLRLT